MPSVGWTRRQTLTALLALGLVPVTHAVSGSVEPLLLSARDDLQRRHGIVGYGLDGREHFSLPVAQRCHDILVHPGGTRALFIARRPGTRCYWVDVARGVLLATLEARELRHFYGHGVFGHDGRTLYLTENDLRSPGRGVIGVYALQHDVFRYSHEISTHGIEPHQLEWLPGKDVLVTANGGMITEAGSREVRNAEAIDSSLVMVDPEGRLLSHDRLDDPWLSIRHIAVAADGSVVTAQQYAGNVMEASSNVSLLAYKPSGGALQPVTSMAGEFQRLNGYLASIAVHPQQPWFATTAPRGNRFLVFDRNTLQCLVNEYMPDCAGLVACRDGFVLSSGQGGCRFIQPAASGVVVERLALPAGGWDNHLRLV